MSDGSMDAVHNIPEPKMRVVTKGWWVLKEERVSADDLLQQDRIREQRLQDRKPGLISRLLAR